jgi:hypothetical protein
MLGSAQPLRFSQDSNGLKVKLPEAVPGDSAYTLKITGLQMNPSNYTASGDPVPTKVGS